MTEKAEENGVEIRKNADEILRVRATEFEGHRLVDIRVWYETDQGGESVLKPTKKGITFKRGLLEEVIPALQAILDKQGVEALSD